MVDLLTKVTYTRVNGRFIVSEGANTDPDADPDDVIPQAGSITFTPLVDAVQFGTASTPVTVTMRPVTCQLDAQGYLIDSHGKRGVWLVATNDLDSIPLIWGYKVREDFDGVKTPRIYTISVPTGSDIDLAIAAPPAAALPGPSANNDHGSVSGDLTVGPGSHEMDLVGNLAVTVAGTGDVTLVVHGTGTVTVADMDFDIDGDAVILVITTPRGVRLAYLAGGGSAEPAVPDTTPPTSMTGLTVSTAGSDGTTATASWPAATDAESTVKYRFRVYPTGGAVPAWPTSGALYNVTGTSKALTGLSAGTPYTIDGQSYSNGGSSTTPATATFTPPAPPGTFIHTDDFTAADGTSLSGRALMAGGLSWQAHGGESSSGNNDWGLIASNKVANSDATGLFVLRGGTITLPQASVAVQVDYDLSTGGDTAAERRTYVWVSSTGLGDCLAVRVNGDGTLTCYKGSVTAVTLTGVTSGIAQSGTVKVEIVNNGANSTLTITHPGGTATATVTHDTNYTGTGRKNGAGARGNGVKVDAFKAALL